MTNKEKATTDTFFIACCAAAKIPATPRQASKFNKKRGLAYAQKNQVLRGGAGGGE